MIKPLSTFAGFALIAIVSVLSHATPLIIGGDHNYPPYEYIDENGNPAGFNPDLIREIADIMKLDVRIGLGIWNKAREDLEAGKTDAACMMYSRERDNILDFSMPHIIVTHSVFVRKDSPVKSVDDIRGLEIITQKGDIMHDFALASGLAGRIATAESQIEVLRLLDSGKHDCALLGKLSGVYWINRHGLANIHAVGGPIQPRRYCIAVAEGRDELLAKLNEGLHILKTTGKYDEIFDNWFGIHEEGADFKDILKYMALLAGPLAVLLIMFWFWSLKRTIVIRTAELNRELAERKRAEEALRLTQFSVDRALDAVFWIGPDARFIYVNDAACITLGYSRDKLLSMSLDDVDTNFPKSQWPERWAAIKRQGSLLIETRHRTSGGGEIPVEVASNYMKLGDKEFSFVFSRDISVRKKAEAEVRESRKKFQALFDLSPLAIALSDYKTGKIIDANRKLHELTGYTRDEVIGQTAIRLGLHSKEDRTRVTNRLIEHGNISGMEMTYTIKDKTTLNTLVYSKIIKLENKAYILWTFLDITHRKRLETKLREARKTEAIATLAGGIAHEFNNALLVITGNLELLNEQFISGKPDLAEYVDSMKMSARSMAQLTKQLLAYARGGNYRVETSPVNDLLRETLRLIQYTIGPGIQIDMDLNPEVKALSVDPVQFQMVLSAVLSNASDAMKDEGRISISTENVEISEPSEADFDILPGGYTRLSITDEGAGMDEDTRKRVFDPFFTTKFQGRGLGMAAVYGIVKNHGGFLDIGSEPGKGTTVSIYLPAVEIGSESEPFDKLVD